MSIHAPYNFVPLSRFVFLPNWAEQVSQDVPFADGVSGSLTIELTCETDTAVGGEQEKGSDAKAGLVKFCRDPNGTPIIPGSSLKGMLSNVMEIASFARFNRLANKRYSVRDISKSDTFYLKEFPGQPKGGKTGWLKYDRASGQWTITPCQMARIHQQDIIEHFNIKKSEWTNSKNNSAANRYELLNGIRSIPFDKEPHKNKGAVAKPNPTGSLTGKLVVTGQPGASFDKNNAKKWEFVFFSDSESTKTVSANVIRDFQFIHATSDEWTHWKQKGKAYDGEGIPVFYQEKGSIISSIGLAYMYRLAYTNSTHEAVINTQATHINSEHPDLPSLIFGQISDQEGQSLRGRVNISAARPKSDFILKTLPATILNGPKPTYYPAYVRQTKVQNDGTVRDAGNYQTMMSKGAELSGYKRYPAQHTADVSMPNVEVGDGDNNKIKVILEPAPAGSQFQFTLRFHNLREVELGAVLWSLDFGDKEGCFHGLGMGKSYGLGRVSLKIASHDLHPNQPKAFSSDELLTKCRVAFKELMNEAYTQMYPQSTWEESAQLNELLSMATPSGRETYMPLKQFINEKNALETLATSTGTVYKHPDAQNTGQNESSTLLTPSDSIEPLDDTTYEQVIEQRRLEQLAKEKDTAEKAQREAAKANASDEDRLVIEFEGLVADFHQNGGTASAKKSAQKKFEAIIKQAKCYDYSEEQVQQILELAESATIADKFIKNFKKSCKREEA